MRTSQSWMSLFSLLALIFVAACGGDNVGPLPASDVPVKGLELTEVQPSVASTAGDVPLLLQGTGFLPGVEVRIGSADFISAEYHSSTELQVRLPPSLGSIGSTALQVRNPDGTTVERRDLFRYMATEVAFETPMFLALDVPRNIYSGFSSMQRVDLNADGLQDVLLIGTVEPTATKGWCELLAFFGQRDGTYGSATVLAKDLPYRVEVTANAADLDGDQKTDIAVVFADFVRIYWGDSKGTPNASSEFAHSLIFSNYAQGQSFKIVRPSVGTEDLIVLGGDVLARFRCGKSRVCAFDWSYKSPTPVQRSIVNDMDGDRAPEVLLSISTYFDIDTTAILFTSDLKGDWLQVATLTMGKNIEQMIRLRGTPTVTTFLTVEREGYTDRFLQEYTLDGTFKLLRGRRKSLPKVQFDSGSNLLAIEKDRLLVSQLSWGRVYEVGMDLSLREIQRMWLPDTYQTGINLQPSSTEENLWFWNQTPLGIFVYPRKTTEEYVSPLATKSPGTTLVERDVSGDGLLDLIKYQYIGDKLGLVLLKRNLSAKDLFTEAGGIPLEGTLRGWQVFPADAGAPMRLAVVLSTDCKDDAHAVKIHLFSVSPGGTFMKEQELDTAQRNSCYLMFNDPHSLAIGDFDGDGRLDIIDAVTNTRTLLYRGGETGFVPKPVEVLRQVSPEEIVAADLNQDGVADLVIRSSLYDTPVQFALGPIKQVVGTDLDFTTLLYPKVPARKKDWIRVVDVNLDGRLDLITAEQFDSNNYKRKRIQVGLSSSAVGTLTWLPPREVNGSPLWTTDLDGDGLTDLLVGEPGQIQMLKTTPLGLQELGRLPINASRVRTGALLAPGREDLLVESDSALLIFPNRTH